MNYLPVKLQNDGIVLCKSADDCLILWYLISLKNTIILTLFRHLLANLIFEFDTFYIDCKGIVGRVFAVTTQAGSSDKFLKSFTLSCSTDGAKFSDVMGTNTTAAYVRIFILIIHYSLRFS